MSSAQILLRITFPLLWALCIPLLFRYKNFRYPLPKKQVIGLLALWAPLGYSLEYYIFYAMGATARPTGGAIVMASAVVYFLVMQEGDSPREHSISHG